MRRAAAAAAAALAGAWLAAPRIRRLRRWLAEAELDRADADLARWYVDDGALSTAPLRGPLSESGRDLRSRRVAAVERLERAGGHDPHPLFLRPPTPAQRAAWRPRG